VATRDERLQAFIRSALEEAFAVSSKDVVKHLEDLIKKQGTIDLLDMPVNDARALLVALCAVESVRADSESARLDVTRQNERRDNGVF
jgi:hypothetical protein